MSVNRCIFCKSHDRTFASREHIVPESLGNTSHILPPGIVCDACNNYFAVKVEGPVLSTPFFTQARSSSAIPNKRGRIPSIKALTFPDAICLHLANDARGQRSIRGADSANGDAFIRLLQRNRSVSMIFPVAEFPHSRLFTRFLAKMALETCAQIWLTPEIDLSNSVIDRPEFDKIRLFSRYGDGVHDWPYSTRRLYPADHKFVNDEDLVCAVTYEHTMLYTEGGELYFVCALFGIEFAINLCGPAIDGYKNFLKPKLTTAPCPLVI